MRRIYLLGLIMLCGLGWGLFRWYQPISINQTVTLREGETITKLYADRGWINRWRMKHAVRQHDEQVAKIQPGSYLFSGTYRPGEVVDQFLAGPETVYEHITVLEGWSSYDIDGALTEAGLINSGAYRDRVTDTTRISDYVDQYEFLQVARQERGDLPSLEGYLYPDTYYIDVSKEVLPQLIALQLQAFKKRVWIPYEQELRDMTDRLRELGYQFRLTTYGTLIVASIVEKEEKYTPNKPEVAAVFFNRLTEGMQLDADISLCYGLAQPYSDCTEQAIVNNLQDSTNVYNTRARGGLPPTPISNPSVTTIRAVLRAEPSPYYYYLHAPSGELHLSESISEHNTKKSKYLR